MRILQLSASDLCGGANRAAFRLHTALIKSGVDSKMLVKSKHSSDPHTYAASLCDRGFPFWGKGRIDMVPRFLLNPRCPMFSIGWQGFDLNRILKTFKPDLVHLHWINGGVVSVRSIRKLVIPVVWTFHDMWAFTGGCHYAGPCRGYESTCASCPQIKPIPVLRRLVSHCLESKHARSEGQRLAAVAPSQWMKQMAADSKVFGESRVQVIPNCCDKNIFSSDRRSAGRAKLGLEKDTFAYLFLNADQQRKGALHASDILDRLSSGFPNQKKRFLFLGGFPRGLTAGGDVFLLRPTSNQEEVAEIQAAADLFILPSLEDNLPNVVAEALSCGTPVAAFPTGGIPEMIIHGFNGLISPQSTADSLASTIIEHLVSLTTPRSEIGAMAHSAYSEDLVASRHRQFYEETLIEWHGRNI